MAYLASTSEYTKKTMTVLEPWTLLKLIHLCFFDCRNNSILLDMDVLKKAYSNNIFDQINSNLWIRAIQHVEADPTLFLTLGENKTPLVMEVLHYGGN